jgi:hypothetical protein
MNTNHTEFKNSPLARSSRTTFQEAKPMLVVVVFTLAVCMYLAVCAV